MSIIELIPKREARFPTLHFEGERDTYWAWLCLCCIFFLEVIHTPLKLALIGGNKKKNAMADRIAGEGNRAAYYILTRSLCAQLLDFLPYSK